MQRKIKKFLFILFFCFLFFEIIVMIINRGNINIDILIFNNFEKIKPYTSDIPLRENQYVIDDSLHTLIKDSIDIMLYVDNELLYCDTLFINDGYKLYRHGFFLWPRVHTITIKSNMLNASYSYNVHNYVFRQIFIESSDEIPYFWISKFYLPFYRREL